MNQRVWKLVVLGLASPMAVHAGDSDGREGFYLSGGLGFHSSALESIDSSNNVITETGSGPVLSIKAGGYINPQWALYYHGRANSWYENYEDALFSASLNGVGTTYYFSPMSGQGYLEASVGVGSLVSASSANTQVEVGTALAFGVGYEATRNLQVGITYSSVSADASEIQDLEFRSTAIALTVEYKL